MKSILLLAIVAFTFSCTFALDIKLNQQWKSWKEADLGVHTYWLGMNKYADMVNFYQLMSDKY
jgi:hypothetical protein